MFVALATTGLGAVLVLATASRPRWTLAGVSITGTDAQGATALALAALAGLGLLLLMRGLGRTVVGVLLVLTGIGVVVVNLRVGQSGSWFSFSPIPDDAQAQRSVWFWLTSAGGVVMALGGGLVAAFGRRWPSARRDYRPTAQVGQPRPDAWSALDRGEDPTL
jgi:hypothetical protein